MTRLLSFRACERRACRGFDYFPTISRIGYASMITPQGRRTSGYTKKIRRPHGLLSISERRAWSQLAYQFGHELGHVMCNSWMWKVETPPPSCWLEECLAEAFSIRGLGRLADAWEREPPFTGDARYGQALRDYRGGLIEKYQKASAPEPVHDIAAWLRANRALLDRADGLGRCSGARDCDSANRDGG